MVLLLLLLLIIVVVVVVVVIIISPAANKYIAINADLSEVNPNLTVKSEPSVCDYQQEKSTRLTFLTFSGKLRVPSELDTGSLNIPLNCGQRKIATKFR